LTGWMKKIFRSEKQRTIVEVGLLWFYAFLTGFSSSVCRSVTMFTFFSINRMMGQRIHSVNGILVSLFLLVVIDPLKLFDVGFQLSYTAIFGIVAVYPVMQKAVPLKNRLLRRVWDAASISLAAQFATAPLVVFYFHQLPLYSVITSLITVPLLSILIAVFVCSVPFISMDLPMEFFNFILVKLALLINRSMAHLSSLPGALLDGLQVDRMTLVIWLLVLLMVMVAFNIRNRMPWYLVLFLTSGALVWNSLSGLDRRNSSELLITHFSRASMVIVREGVRVDYYQFCSDTAVLDRMKNYIGDVWSRRIYENHQMEMADTGEAMGSVSSCIRIRDGLWLLGSYQHSGLIAGDKIGDDLREAVFGDPGVTHTIHPGFLLLSGDPEAEAFLDKGWTGDMDVVADGSCSKRYLTRIKADQRGFYLTDRSGAYAKRW
jgi:ComEC/Rec2-related protein